MQAALTDSAKLIGNITVCQGSDRKVYEEEDVLSLTGGIYRLMSKQTNSGSKSHVNQKVKFNPCSVLRWGKEKIVT